MTAIDGIHMLSVVMLATSSVKIPFFRGGIVLKMVHYHVRVVVGKI